MNENLGSALLRARIYFSYNQFLVFDKSVALPGCAWTLDHHRQGFARREQNVAFGTLLEFGHGDLTVHAQGYRAGGGTGRVIEVPFEVSSGEVVIAGPEEFGDTRTVKLVSGHYKLTAAQTATGDEKELIDLYFEKLAEPLAESRIAIADDALDPPSPLLETAEVA